jgi:bifunctional non-homologous end joining protein LigD
MATHGPLAPYRAKRDFARTKPLAWREVAARLDPKAVHDRHGAGAPARADPWAGFAAAARPPPWPR